MNERQRQAQAALAADLDAEPESMTEAAQKIYAERRRKEAAEAASEEKRVAALERAADAKAADWQERARKDPTHARRSYEYGQLLLQMSASGSYLVGSDGAPNWPDPPVPGEKGIVSKATAHLVPPRPQ